jgi:hypothetical protein
MRITIGLIVLGLLTPAAFTTFAQGRVPGGSGRRRRYARDRRHQSSDILYRCAGVGPIL